MEPYTELFLSRVLPVTVTWLIIFTGIEWSTRLDNRRAQMTSSLVTIVCAFTLCIYVAAGIYFWGGLETMLWSFTSLMALGLSWLIRLIILWRLTAAVVEPDAGAVMMGLQDQSDKVIYKTESTRIKQGVSIFFGLITYLLLQCLVVYFYLNHAGFLSWE